MEAVVVSVADGTESVESGILAVPHGVRSELAARWSAVDIHVQKSCGPIAARGKELRVDTLCCCQAMAGGARPQVLPEGNIRNLVGRCACKYVGCEDGQGLVVGHARSGVLQIRHLSKILADEG